MKKITLKIVGMHCTACALTIDLDLEELSGVKFSKTNYAKQITEVEYDPSLVNIDQLLASVSNSGYEAIAS
jgi:P-type Cu+ transporter